MGYVKSKFNVKLVHSESIGKQLKFLAVKVELAKGLYVTVVGCYRPPSVLSIADSYSTPLQIGLL